MWASGTGWRGYRRHARLRHDSRLFLVPGFPGRPLLLINLAGGGCRYHRSPFSASGTIPGGHGSFLTPFILQRIRAGDSVHHGEQDRRDTGPLRR